MNNIILSDGTNPFKNLSAEEYLFDNCGKNVIFYLWQNKNTIVIGRTQNAFKECNVSEFEKDGGIIARRPTGGGAVFHDTGNLNFTFICPDEIYDVNRQLGVILSAVKSFGIDAEFSGRNDILAAGRKFSGNAFRHSKGISMHHGTILFNADLTKLPKYLNVTKAKIEGKGISSVQSRVVNLCELNPAINVENLKGALIKSFTQSYGESKMYMLKDFICEESLKPYEEKYASWEWRFGENPQFNTEITKKYSFGIVNLMLEVKNGIITEVKVYSDALNTEFICSLEGILKGLKYSAESVKTAVKRELCNFSEAAEFFNSVDELM